MRNEKTFTDGGKIEKFVKVFSLESFPLYGNAYSDMVLCESMIMGVATNIVAA